MSNSNKNYNRRAGTPSLIVGLSLAVIAAVIALIVSSQTNRNQEQKPVAQISSQNSSVVSTASRAESSEDSKKEEETIKRSGLEIRYIDVGQGNSTLVLLPDGKNLLIDAGPKESSDKLVSYLKNEKIKKIDYLIATNADVNDIGGMSSVIENFDIGRVYAPNVEDIINSYETEKNVAEVYKSFTNALSAKKLIKLDASSGTHIYFSLSLTVDIISPNDSAYSDLNNYSTAVLLKYGQQKFIFMSDAENYSEQEIIDNGIDVTSDVIMIGNHGSSAASGKSFIKAVAPKYAVISCGANNIEGYPHQETLKTLESCFISLEYATIPPLKYSELPGTEVIKAAIPPPVQLSAVERDRFFAFNSSPISSSSFIPYYIGNIFFLQGDTRISGRFYRTKVLIQIFEVAGNGDHCSIIRCITELRNEYVPTVFCRMFAERVAQTVICRYTAGNSHFFYIILLCRLTQFIH